MLILFLSMQIMSQITNINSNITVVLLWRCTLCSFNFSIFLGWRWQRGNSFECRKYFMGKYGCCIRLGIYFLPNMWKWYHWDLPCIIVFFKLHSHLNVRTFNRKFFHFILINYMLQTTNEINVIYTRFYMYWWSTIWKSLVFPTPKIC